MRLDRARRRARPLVLAAMAVTMGFALIAAVPQIRADSLLDRPLHFVAPWYFVPGAIVVLRREGHVIGWLLAVTGLLWAVMLTSEVAAGAPAGMPEAWSAWTGYWIGLAIWAAMVALFVLFPDGLGGRSPRQRWAGRAMIATAAIATVGAMLPSQVVSEVHGSQPNPTGLGVLPLAVTEYLILPVGVVGLGAVVGLWRRSRHAAGAARRQYAWVLFGFAVVVAGLVVGLALGAVLGDAAWAVIIVGWWLVPTAFSVAILRHRLYDIERIVSRTVAYATVTAVVAGIYALPVVALPELFGLRGPLPVAAATLAAAAAFTPVRRGVQQWVDRHFNRARFDARRELDAFAVRLRAPADLESVVADINGLVDRTLQPSAVVTWVRPAAPRR